MDQFNQLLANIAEFVPSLSTIAFPMPDFTNHPSFAVAETPVANNNATSKCKRQSAAWKFYTEVGDRRICKICGKGIAATNGNTTGMLRHLRSMHKDSWQILEMNEAKTGKATNGAKLTRDPIEAIPTTLSAPVECYDQIARMASEWSETMKNVSMFRRTLHDQFPEWGLISDDESKENIDPPQAIEQTSSIQLESFEAEFAELIEKIGKNVDFPEEKLRVLLRRLQRAYLAVKELPILRDEILKSMETDVQGDLDFALTRQVAAKYGIDAATVEDAPTLVMAIFFGSVAMDYINTAVKYEIFQPEEHLLVEAVCAQLLSPD